jgi:hypothetical protein
MLPSGDEAQRLKKSLQNCVVRHFKDNGHTLLLVGENMYICCIYCHGAAAYVFVSSHHYFQVSKASDDIKIFHEYWPF